MWNREVACSRWLWEEASYNCLPKAVWEVESFSPLGKIACQKQYKEQNFIIAVCSTLENAFAGGPKRQHWHDYVPIAFHRWLFVRKLRLRFGLKLRGRESPHFQIRREWRLWVRKSVNWLILGTEYIAKLDRDLKEKLRKRPLKNLMPSGFTLSQLD